MTASDPRVGEIQARLDAVESKTVHNAVFGDILRTGWCTYYFGADNQWHNARTGEVIGDLDALEDERLAEDEISEWLTPYAPADVAYLLAELRDRDEKLARVEALAEAVTLFENALGLDLSDDDFDRGWHGRGREMADKIRAAVAAANGGGDRG